MENEEKELWAVRLSESEYYAAPSENAAIEFAANVNQCKAAIYGGDKWPRAEIIVWAYGEDNWSACSETFYYDAGRVFARLVATACSVGRGVAGCVSALEEEVARWQRLHTNVIEVNNAYLEENRRLKAEAIEDAELMECAEANIDEAGNEINRLRAERDVLLAEIERLRTASAVRSLVN